jgi:hypothetical protein
MKSEENICKDKEFLWTVFKKTGLIGAYLMHEEFNEDEDIVTAKKMQKDDNGKRTGRFGQ